MERPAPFFMGYRVKRPWTPDPQWWPEGAGRVERVCSVSDCLAEPPQGWVERWDFNRASCYATEQEALATVPAGTQDAFALFAYWLVPVTRDGEGQTREVSPEDVFPASLPPLPPEPTDLPGYRSLGYDVVGVQGLGSIGFECSPLSCNSMAQEIPVNRSCLIDELEEALQVAQRFNGGDGVEPGDYVVVKVAMKAPR